MATRAMLATALMALAVSLGAAPQQAVPPPPATPPVASPPASSSTVTPRTVVPRPEGSPLAPESAVIVGQVVDGNGRAVPNAAVHLIGENGLDAVLTDDKGRFLFERIPPGEAIVIAAKHGYYDGAYGKRRPSGVPLPVSLHAGEGISDMRIELFRAAVVTGSVVDDNGDPLVGVRVVAMRRAFDNGRWTYEPASAEETDDQGFYRIFDLVPGQYVVVVPTTSYSVPMTVIDAQGATGSADGGLAMLLDKLPGKTGPEKSAASGRIMRVTPDGHDIIWSSATAPPDDNGQEAAYVTQFYPYTDRQMLALLLTIAAGDVRYAVDFQLAAVAVHRVSGRLIGDPAAAANQLIRLVPVGLDSDGGDDSAATVSMADGTFSFRRVPAGDYRLEVGNGRPAFVTETGVVPGPPGSSAFWARTDVFVQDADVEVPELTMQPDVSVSIVVAAEPDAEGKAADISFFKIPITIAPVGPGLSSPIHLTAGTEFTADDLIPGRYYVRIGALPAGWFVKSIQAAGQDAMDEPVEIGENGEPVVVTITTRATEILGTVRDALNQPAAGATVIIMPITSTGQSVWTPNRLRETRSSTAGVFTVKGLPPGEYLAVAIDDAVAEGWQDERVVATLRRQAIRFTLQVADSKSLNLRLSVLKR
jgi:protocatechuate 3,4-dioxygenase beta subunit